MRTVFTFCFLLFHGLLPAQEIKLLYEKQKILLGEQMQVKAIAQIDKGQNAGFFSLDTLPHLEVLEQSKSIRRILVESCSYRKH